MDEQLSRIEAKLDTIAHKLDNHLERITRAETSIGWIRWGLSLLLVAASTAALALAKFVKE